MNGLGAPRTPPRSRGQRQRRRALTAFGAFGGWWGAWGALVPSIQTSARVDDGQLGVALLFVGVGALASMRATGALIDRFGGAVLPASLVSFGLAGLLPAFARGTVALGSAMLLVGVASGGMDVAINSASARYEQLSGRPLMNLAHACFSFGVIGASASVGLLRSAGSTSRTILSVGAGMLVLLAALIHRWRDATTDAAVGDTTGADWPWWRPPARLATIGVLVGLAFLVENAWQSWSALHMERNLGVRAGGGAMGPVAFALAAASGRLLGQRLLRHLSDRRLVASGASVAAIGTVVAAVASSVPIGLAGIATAGLGSSVCAPTLLGLAARDVPERRQGAVVGSVTTLAYLGFVLAPAYVGLMSRATTLRWALASVAFAAIALAVGARWASAATVGVGPDR